MLSASATPVNLVANGDFEGGHTAWDLGGNGIGFDGTSYVLFGGCAGANCSTTQTIFTVIGRKYIFSFDYATDTQTPNYLAAVFGGQTVFGVQDDTTGSFTNKSFLVTATSTATLIDIQIRNDHGASVVDNVSVTAVPEPTTAALMALGLAGLALRRARKV